MIDILATLFIVVVSTTIASYIVARFVREPLHAASDGEEDFVLEHEFKYLDELETLERLPLSESALRDLQGRVVTDDTPCGKVVVTYNHDEKRFEYWSERSQIPYKTLDAVARKFCIENDCRSIYLDVYEELYLEAVKNNRAAIAAAMNETDEMDGPASRAVSPVSDNNDLSNLYGENHLSPGSSDLDLDLELDDGPNENTPLLEQSIQKEKASPFATFKKYNAPVKRAQANNPLDETGALRAMKNSFKRRGTYREWEASILAATLLAQQTAKTLPMAEEDDARQNTARRRRHFNLNYEDFKRQTRSSLKNTNPPEINHENNQKNNNNEIEMVEM